MQKNKEKEAVSSSKCVYENRELSWLRFNERVLSEAKNESIPLCERMTFLSIFQTNLDEFFMVRVGSLEDQKLLKEPQRENKTNMTPQEQIAAILQRVTELNREKDAVYEEILQKAREHGVYLLHMKDLTKIEQKNIAKYYEREIAPLLSAMIVGRKQPFPFLKGGEIYAIANIGTKSDKEKLGIIPCGSGIIPRLIPVPGKQNTFLLSEELILHFLPEAFKGYRIAEKTLIRITRNADIDVDKVYDEDLNYRDQMAHLVKQRKKLTPVRLEMNKDYPFKMLSKVCEYYELAKEQVFETGSPLDLSFLFTIEDVLRKDPGLVFERQVPQPPAMLDRMKPVIPQVLKKDVLLSYPYESITPFLHMLQEAARDPQVISIRMTLYRLAKNSKVVEALAEAAENGKQVDVLVELKARFDEENNIEWSRRLEDAGCHVVYGVDGLKVHSKLCLITRKGEEGIQYITQVGTGNYNEKTARLYTDLSLITSDHTLGEEAARIFQALFLGDVVEKSTHFLVAPRSFQTPVIELIEHEIQMAKDGKPAYIGIKINSLTDKMIMDKLIEASQAGVQIDMVVRGICCLRSQIPGMTDNIHIVSIVGRYLEHARIYIFGTEDRDKIYIASADFMTRNTLRRVEVGAPVYDAGIKARIREMFRMMLRDTVKGRVQQKDGSYQLPEHPVERFEVQEYLYKEACQKAKEQEERNQA